MGQTVLTFDQNLQKVLENKTQITPHYLGEE